MRFSLVVGPVGPVPRRGWRRSTVDRGIVAPSPRGTGHFGHRQNGGPVDTARVVVVATGAAGLSLVCRLGEQGAEDVAVVAAPPGEHAAPERTWCLEAQPNPAPYQAQPPVRRCARLRSRS